MVRHKIDILKHQTKRGATYPMDRRSAAQLWIVDPTTSNEVHSSGSQAIHNDCVMAPRKRRARLFLVGILFHLGTLAAAVLLQPCASFSIDARFSATRSSAKTLATRNSKATSKFMSSASSASSSTEDEYRSSTSTSTGTTSIETYSHDEWSLTYRYKPASTGYESKTPLLLIHPVGIGISSWFWEKFFQAWQGPELYAPDLIGCGVKNGGDAWDPSERGLFFPLSWVQGCEALIQTRCIVPNTSGLALLFQRNYPHVNVVCQGGLAPVGIMLAARNPSLVQKLVLTSPPTWKDMTTPIPETELSRNYEFLRSPVVAPVAFGILETRGAIEFFSNLFLFQNQCDQEWLEYCRSETCETSRSPIAAFNAGFCNARSFQEELETLHQPTLILSGHDDGRTAQRHAYKEKMQDCTLKSLPGLNVLPWESPKDVVRAIQEFCY